MFYGRFNLKRYRFIIRYNYVLFIVTDHHNVNFNFFQRLTKDKR